MTQPQSPKEALKALVRNLVSGLAEQQATYDSSWQPELNAVLAAIDQLGVPAEGWVSVDVRLPPLDTPVLGLTPGGALSVFMRDDGGGDGWLWAQQTWKWNLADKQGMEVDDDYEVAYWQALPAAPKEPTP